MNTIIFFKKNYKILLITILLEKNTSNNTI